MRMALGLAGRGLGAVAPNPAVGCVVVRTEGGRDRIVGRGWTQPGGRPHAETEALARAGAAAKAATAYVSLEPCNHHGKTPPCTEALIAAGVTRVVAAMEDPDPRVAGAGLRRLREAGVEVDCGVCEEEAARLNAGFLMRQRAGRPLVSLKTATTLDGRIAARSGESQWITGPEARAWTHLMRAKHDAVMVGIGTASVDDPSLTCRLPGLGRQSPIRIVVDARLRLPIAGKLVQTAKEVPTWVIALEGAEREPLDTLEAHGVKIVPVPPAANGYPDPEKTLTALGERGLTRVMVEGGATLAAALLRARLVDRLAWFRSASVMGGDGIPAVEGYGVDTLSLMARFARRGIRRLGEDVLETFDIMI